MDRRRRRRGAGATFSPLVSPIDETLASHFVESDAAIIDAAVKHSHAAYVKHQDETIAKRVEWLTAAADATDKIEAELIRSLIRVIGKPKRAATFEAKRQGHSSAPARRNCPISTARCCRWTPKRPAPAASDSRHGCPTGS
jgi:acyl-CoA reductase-like NAD-dependent aldehyde dehydrogenase